MRKKSDGYDEGLAFTAINEDGECVECEMLFTLVSAETGKEYIVYTDDSMDDKGYLGVFASVYLHGTDGVELAPIETESEWEIIEIALKNVLRYVDESGEDGEWLPKSV